MRVRVGSDSGRILDAGIGREDVPTPRPNVFRSRGHCKAAHRSAEDYRERPIRIFPDAHLRLPLLVNSRILELG